MPNIPTPSQTAGPFLSIGTTWLTTEHLVPVDDPWAVELAGMVIDGSGAPVTDAMLEFWQADEQGRFPPEAPAGWTGFGRVFSDPVGSYRFVTRKPGATPARPGGDDLPEAPHLNVSIFARGLLQRLFTRIYFDGEPGNGTDPVLSGLAPELAERLVAGRQAPGGGHPRYHFDVHLQGEKETVFFAFW